MLVASGTFIYSAHLTEHNFTRVWSDGRSKLFIRTTYAKLVSLLIYHSQLFPSTIAANPTKKFWRLHTLVTNWVMRISLLYVLELDACSILSHPKWKYFFVAMGWTMPRNFIRLREISGISKMEWGKEVVLPHFRQFATHFRYTIIQGNFRGSLKMKGTQEAPMKIRHHNLLLSHRYEWKLN
jgi:hypothetical protein